MTEIMKWRDRHDKQWAYTTEEAVRHYINTCPDYHAGAVEALRNQVNALTELVAVLVSLLPDDAKREIVPYYTGMVDADSDE